MKIRHVIPGLDAAAPEQLKHEHEAALETILRAKDFTRSDLEVDVVVAREPEAESLPAPVLTRRVLIRSSLDVVPEGVKKRLPLLSETLQAFGPAAEFDLAILTNADIAVLPHFYEAIATLYESGTDAGCITRRTIALPFSGTLPEELAAASLGSGHPGHDCFYMPSATVEQLDVGLVTLGAQVVIRPLLASLLANSKSFTVLKDLHLTYHLGDDREWTSPEFDANWLHNSNELMLVLQRLAERFGSSAVDEYFFEFGDNSHPEVVKPPEIYQAQKMAAGRRRPKARLVFTACPPRSGTQFLATIFDAAPNCSATHECQPHMSGKSLRLVEKVGMFASYAERLVKAKEIKSQMNELRPWESLVDSSPMFLKTHSDVVFDCFPHESIAVIDLKRDPVAVAKSHYELGYFTKDNDAWVDWLVSLTSAGSFFSMNEGNIEDSLDLIFGSLVETQARLDYFRDRTPRSTWLTFHLEDLMTEEGAAKLFRALGHEPPKDLCRLLRDKINDRSHRKAAFDRTIDYGLVSTRLNEFLDRHAGRPAVSRFRAAYEIYLIHPAPSAPFSRRPTTDNADPPSPSPSQSPSGSETVNWKTAVHRVTVRWPKLNRGLRNAWRRISQN